MWLYVHRLLVLVALVFLAAAPTLARAERGAEPVPVIIPMAGPDGAPQPLAILSATDKKDLARIEAYFNALPPVAATFTQQAQQLDGSLREASGTFKLWRPGRLRIDYNKPLKDFIVADGRAIYQWDGAMQQQSQMGIGDSLPGVLLRKNFSFAKDVTVVGVKRPSPKVLEVALRSVKDPGAGELTLVLRDFPLQLSSWRVLDAQGLVTNVLLNDVTTGAKFNKADFVFRKPEGSDRR